MVNQRELNGCAKVVAWVVVGFVALLAVSCILYSALPHAGDGPDKAEGEPAKAPAKPADRPAGKHTVKRPARPKEPAEPAPVEFVNVAVSAISVKQVGGQYRYFFKIANDDRKPFDGAVEISLHRELSATGESLAADTFTTKATMPAEGHTVVYSDASQGPATVRAFKWSVKIGGRTSRTGWGSVPEGLTAD